MQAVAIPDFLNSPTTKSGMERCARVAIEALHTDQALRVPRAPDQRSNRFALWRAAWRDRLGAAMEDEFSREFPDVAKHLSPAAIKEVVSEHVWPHVETELMAYALQGIARAWVRRRMGDATTIGPPRLEADRWIIPLGIQGGKPDLGQVVLDLDGNVLEDLSSTRSQILASLHA